MIGDYSHLFFSELEKIVDFENGIDWDMQPLEALRNMLSNPEYTDRYSKLKGCIGGSPQVLKIYPYMRTLEFAVHWPTRANGKLHLNGRRTFEWENITLPQIDMHDMTIFYPLAEIGKQDQ